MTYISHKLDIAENHVEGLELQWTGGVKRGLPLLQNITKRALAVVVFCYNHCGEKEYRKRDTLSGRWENLPRKKKKRRKENTVKHTQRRYISYKEEIANGTICPVDNTLKRLTKN